MPAPAPIGRRRVVRLALGGAVVVAGGAGLVAAGANALRPPAGDAPAALRALSLGGPWLNSPPLGPADLRGKVVLANVWTYSCINSLRPLPYVRAWAEAYQSRGLVVVGVHTPEFAFEKDLANVRHAVDDLGVGFPVVLDSDYRIWRAFDNEAWPAFHLLGADGRLRSRVYGEGRYDSLEADIRKLLGEAGETLVTNPVTVVPGEGVEAAPDFASLKSPETYLGHARASNFAFPGGVRRDTPSRYAAAPALALNHWSLTGRWNVGPEFATLASAPGVVTLRFHARDVHMVLGPGPSARPVRFRVRVDGAPPGPDHGVDVDAAGLGTVREPRMYQLVRQSGPIGDRTFQLEVLDAGLRAYVFTFG